MANLMTVIAGSKFGGKHKRPKGVFTMKSSGSKTAEILIYDAIGVDPWFGDGVGSKAFVEQLAALGELDSITVRINSPGGDVFEGVAIYNALKAHPAQVNVQIDSLAASIATVIAMAGDTISISDSGMLMVHNASGVCFGEATDMRAMADLLDKIRSGMMLGAYARTGKSQTDLIAIMDAETWYTAQEAIDAGFVDSLVESPSKKPAARAKFDLSAFKHPPKALTTALKEEAASDDEKKCTCLCTQCVDGDCAACTDPDCKCEGCTCDMGNNATAKGPENTVKTGENPEMSEESQRLALLSAKYRAEDLRLSELG